MGCAGKPSTDEEENLDEYDERYDFYNFRSKRIAKNPVPPLKDYSENKNNKSENKEEELNENEENEDEEGQTKKNKKNNKNNKNNKENNSSNEELKGDNNNYGDLYRNNNKKNNKNPNGDINDVLNNNENNSSNGKKSKNKNNIGYDDKNNNKKRKNNNNNNNNYIFNDVDSNSNINIESYKNIFSEKGKTIPNYDINNNKIPEESKLEEEKNKNIKKSKINGITIVENLKDYFPDDISKEEIKTLVFEAFGDSIVEDISLYIPGQTVTYEQAIELSNYVYNFIKNKTNKNEKCLEDLNIKIDLVPLNKKLIKDKMFKGKEPSDKELEKVYQSYGGESSDIKVLTIEFQ